MTSDRGRDLLVGGYSVIVWGVVLYGRITGSWSVFSGCGSLSLWPRASRIKVFGAQHFVPALRHLNISVISAFPTKKIIVQHCGGTSNNVKSITEASKAEI